MGGVSKVFQRVSQLTIGITSVMLFTHFFRLVRSLKTTLGVIIFSLHQNDPGRKFELVFLFMKYLNGLRAFSI